MGLEVLLYIVGVCCWVNGYALAFVGDGDAIGVIILGWVIINNADIHRVRRRLDEM
jgi:hypothetical protein